MAGTDNYGAGNTPPRQLTAAYHTAPPQVRAALVRDDDIGGIAVHIGARVSALAGPNDLLVSSTLRDLVIGSGLEFEERGSYELKGVPGEWHLLAVASP
jgi:class 3 adenylate cyclase